MPYESNADALPRHSGVSWAVNAGKKEVRLVDDWPNPQATVATHEKVPTKIAYKGGKPVTWGYNIGSGEQCFQWFKILLDPENKYRKHAQQPLESQQLMGSINKTADEVVADYMRMLWDYTKLDIARLKGDNWQSAYELKIVITVPAIWSDAAKVRTKKAAEAAGIPSNISLVSEPEAAAHAVLANMSDEDEPLEVR